MEKRIFIEVCSNSNSMAHAASRLGMHFNTFKRKALEYGCYKPNQGSKGSKKPWKENGFDLHDILNGEHPQYQTFKLKRRLLTEGIKDNRCEICGISEWNNKPINCELDHINGDRTDHRLTNLRILCPNCHSQTDTFRAKNIKRR